MASCAPGKRRRPCPRQRLREASACSAAGLTSAQPWPTGSGVTGCGDFGGFFGRVHPILGVLGSIINQHCDLSLISGSSPVLFGGCDTPRDKSQVLQGHPAGQMDPQHTHPTLPADSHEIKELQQCPGTPEAFGPSHSELKGYRAKLVTRALMHVACFSSIIMGHSPCPLPGRSSLDAFLFSSPSPHLRTFAHAVPPACFKAG